MADDPDGPDPAIAVAQMVYGGLQASKPVLDALADWLARPAVMSSDPSEAGATLCTTNPVGIKDDEGWCRRMLLIQFTDQSDPPADIIKSTSEPMFDAV